MASTNSITTDSTTSPPPSSNTNIENTENIGNATNTANDTNISNTDHKKAFRYHSGGPNIEIMPSGVPPSFYMQPMKYHDAQLRAALVELKHTLEQHTKQPMSSDATPLLEAAAKEIRKNQFYLVQGFAAHAQFVQTQNSSINNTSHGVTINEPSPKISSMDIEMAFNGNNNSNGGGNMLDDPMFDDIDWESVL